jgi:hypothetical protein
MRDFRYDDSARRFDEELTEEIMSSRKAAEAKEEERRASLKAERRGGLDAIADGTPLDQVKAVIEAKKRPAAVVLKEHEVGKKMAAMIGDREAAVDRFLGTKG